MKTWSAGMVCKTVSADQVCKDSRIAAQGGAAPYSERCDAKQPGHSGVRAVRSHRAHIRGVPRIEVRPSRGVFLLRLLC